MSILHLSEMTLLSIVLQVLSMVSVKCTTSQIQKATLIVQMAISLTILTSQIIILHIEFINFFLSGSPQVQLGLAADSEIFGFYFTVSLELARESGFSHLQKYFQKVQMV